jgi:hypothetical protein
MATDIRDYLADELGGGSVSNLNSAAAGTQHRLKSGGDRHFHWFGEAATPPAGQKAARQIGCVRRDPPPG